MSDDTWLKTEYNGDTGASECLEVNVMGEAGRPSDDFEDAWDGIRIALDQAYNSSHTDIQGTIARKIDTNHTLTNDDYWDSGEQWLEDHGYGDGVYLWVCDVNTAGVASSWGGWGDKEQAFVNYRYFENQNVASVAVQEGLHPYLLASCDYVEDLCNGDSMSDHALGEVHNWNPDEASPMCYTYVGDGAADQGECGYYDDLEDGGTWVITECTEKALEHSKDHHQGDHQWWR